ncbi:MAG: hypothetical protein WBB85_16130, partial [Albidovulum sp.]|uniref:hypothetical protein n=1 Tax=Albidovulum sp. TaxID=1872424 RepID=UPI003CC42C14
SWMRAEARLKTETTVTDVTTNKFGAGHVISLWAQSQHENIVDVFYSQFTAPTISDAEAVQVYKGAASTPTRHFISDATPVSSALAAMAETLIDAAPGHKFSVIFQTKGGSSPNELVDDGNATRSWAADKALHDLAVTDGAHVGLAMWLWFGSPGSGFGANYADAIFPLFGKKTLAGADVTIPGTITHGGGSYNADHWFGELYDYAKTKWVSSGPHRFDINADMQNAFQETGGAFNNFLVNMDAARDAWRAATGNANATMFLPDSFEHIVYENGRTDGSGGWTDQSHGGTGPDGTALLARNVALSALDALGITAFTVPEFDSCTWEAAGAYVEVGSSAGNITTTRLARGDAALGTTFPHWSEVMGFYINGVPAENASIVAGKVRILPNSGSFVSSDVLSYGDGGSTGQQQYPEDMLNATWKNLPIVDVGEATVDGVGLRPRPAPSVFANTLAGAAKFTTLAGQTTRFKDLVALPAAMQQITIYVDAAIGAGFSGGPYLFSVEGTPNLRIQVLNDGKLRLIMYDTTGTNVFNDLILDTITAGNRFKFTFSIDLANTNECWTTFNGVATQRNFTGRAAGFASGVQKLRFLSGIFDNLPFIGDVYELAVWNEYVSGGGNPANDTNLRTNGRIVGPAATANAHPWKLGGDTT